MQRVLERNFSPQLRTHAAETGTPPPRVTHRAALLLVSFSHSFFRFSLTLSLWLRLGAFSPPRLLRFRRVTSSGGAAPRLVSAARLRCRLMFPPGGVWCGARSRDRVDVARPAGPKRSRSPAALFLCVAVLVVGARDTCSRAGLAKGAGRDRGVCAFDETSVGSSFADKVPILSRSVSECVCYQRCSEPLAKTSGYGESVKLCGAAVLL